MGGYVLLLVVIVAIVGVVILNDKSNEKIRRQKAERLQAAFDTYQSALSRLKSSPTNADLKQETLRNGRTYATLTREQSGSGVTIFDEIALSNDINAATAGAEQRYHRCRPMSWNLQQQAGR
jgi:hypothetical protein